MPSISFQELTWQTADIRNLLIFCSRVLTIILGTDKLPKLDHKNTNSILFGYTVTDKYLYFEDDESGRVLISTHILYNEVHMSVTHKYTPLGAHLLQHTGSCHEDEHKIHETLR